MAEPVDRMQTVAGNVAENAILRLIARASIIILPGIFVWGFNSITSNINKLSQEMTGLKETVIAVNKDISYLQGSNADMKRVVEQLQLRQQYLNRQ